MIAVIPVRDGVLPSGTWDGVAECDGRVIVIGSGTQEAARELDGHIEQGWCFEVGVWAPSVWATLLHRWSPPSTTLVLPASPDGRDLAPRLAHLRSCPLYAGAVELRGDRVTVSRWGGQVLEDIAPPGPYVATLQPGVRGDEPGAGGAVSVWHGVDLEPGSAANHTDMFDAHVLEVQPPDAATMDLAEAPHIWAGGAGLDSEERFTQLGELGRRLGASVGATRVITDRGWIGHERQIGTTGVVVRPRWYVALGISGAVQHTSGLGHPDHIISVNTDPHCPMMQLADVAIVADANAVLDALMELTQPRGDRSD
jgi:electron transfer flavoprotein alpha subunit